MKLYPLKFYPILKERLWGGTKLGELLGKDLTNDNIGESWEISGVEGNVSVVANGILKDTSLSDLIQANAEELLGKSVIDRFGKEFPILIKFIDAREDLSIQVHPNDSLAKKRHHTFGKTEMWYIMDANPDSKLIVGFNRDVTKREYTESINNNTLLDLLNYEPVKEGDSYFINTGKIHAIGAGVLLAEIQQTSDITYRVFDFNRKDKNGEKRELHTELAIDALDYTQKDDFKLDYPQLVNTVNPMVSNPCFTTNFIALTNDFSLDLSHKNSFTIFMCLEGATRINNDSGSVLIKKGETVLIPAILNSVHFATVGVKLLEVSI